MKLIEVTKKDKSFLKLKNIDYDFSESYQNVLVSYKYVGSDPVLKAGLKTYISMVQSNIDRFLSEGFLSTDKDVVKAVNIRQKIEDIKNKL